MSYALLSQAKGWIQNAIGTTDSATLTAAVNDIRRELYAWYNDVRLFVDIEECFEVQNFCFDCNASQDCYRGITLPRDYANIEALWLNDRPAILHSRWRQWQQGMASECDSGLIKFDMGDNFPTERDIPPNTTSRIVVTALDPRDKGKRIIISGTSITGDPFKQEMGLLDTPTQTDMPLKSILRPGGIIKDITLGRVAVSREGGRLLTILDPQEQVPAYKRIRIGGLPAGQNFVNVRAARRYTELFDEYDVVESDNQRMWDAMARALVLNRKAERTSTDLRSEQLYRSQAREMLLGDKSRELGTSTHTQVNVAIPTMRHRRLSRHHG